MFNLISQFICHKLSAAYFNADMNMNTYVAGSPLLYSNVDIKVRDNFQTLMELAAKYCGYPVFMELS